MTTRKSTQDKRRRQLRVRATVSGTAERPRLAVGRSLSGLYVQLVDDDNGSTIVSVNSKKDASGDAGDRKGKVAVAYQLGMAIAKKAKDKKISKVVFDRSGNQYHGRVKAVAEGAREGGLDF